MTDTQEELIVNRFEQVLNHWICIHDENIHFAGQDPNYHCIKLCTETLRIRANDAWTKLPKNLKEATVAHELGHLEMNHVAQPSKMVFGRLSYVMRGSVDPKELEADHYACKLIGREKYSKALKEMISLAQNAHRHELSIYELMLREKEIAKQLRS
jgi:hypothetical protein